MSSTILGPVGPRRPSVWCVTRTMDPPPGLIAVPVPKAVLLLTHAEFVRGVKRGSGGSEPKRQPSARPTR